MNTKIIVVKALLLSKQNDSLYFLELTRSSKKLVAPGMGDLPGGKVDEGESLEAALMREIKEETGILVSQLHKIIDYRWMHGDQEYHEHLYCAFATTQKITLALEEHDNYRWVPFNKLNESLLHPNIKKIIESEKERIHKVAENNVTQITFKRMQSSDFKKIYDWIQQPHVSKWWSDPNDWSEFKLKFQRKLESPYRSCFIIYVDDTAIGYIQSYAANKFPEWPSEQDGTYGMDLFIGEDDYIGKGYGSRIVAQFVQELFKSPKVERIIINPDINNSAAIKAYERAGFKAVKEKKRPSETELLMEIKRLGQ